VIALKVPQLGLSPREVTTLLSNFTAEIEIISTLYALSPGFFHGPLDCAATWPACHQNDAFFAMRSLSGASRHHLARGCPHLSKIARPKTRCLPLVPNGISRNSGYHSYQHEYF
jgi:hypothetical protein